MTGTRRRAAIALLLTAVLAGVWGCGHGADDHRALPPTAPPTTAGTSPQTSGPDHGPAPTTASPPVASTRPLPTSPASTAPLPERPVPPSTTVAGRAPSTRVQRQPRAGREGSATLLPIPPSKQAGTPGLTNVGFRAFPITSGEPGIELEIFSTDIELSKLVVTMDADVVTAAEPSQGSCVLKAGEFVCHFGATKPGQPVVLLVTTAKGAKEPTPVALKGTGKDGTEYEGGFDVPVILR